LKFAWDKVERVFAEPNWPDLLAEHYAEMGGLKPDPDYEAVIADERDGFYRVWTARDRGLLVGYIGWHIFRAKEYRSTLQAVDGLFLLSAPYRKGLAGYSMIARCLPALQDIGVQRVCMINVVAWDRARVARGLPTMDLLFKRLGFEHTDNIWTKPL
jgi:hypothetical protein